MSEDNEERKSDPFEKAAKNMNMLQKWLCIILYILLQIGTSLLVSQNSSVLVKLVGFIVFSLILIFGLKDIWFLEGEASVWACFLIFALAAVVEVSLCGPNIYPIMVPALLLLGDVLG